MRLMQEFNIDSDSMDIDLTEPTTTTSTTSSIEKVLITTTPTPARKTRTNFILDSGSTKHIIARKELFSSFTSSVTNINWGNNSSV